jgi:hypothetical protein
MTANMKTTHILGTVLSVVFCLGNVCRAEEKNEPKVEVKIPDTADLLWAEIDSRFKTLGEVVKTKDAKAVYTAAETVEALVRAVPGKYPDLAVDKRKRVEGQVKNTARVLDDLHDAMSAGKAEEAVKKLTQVESALKIIRSQVGK